MQLGIDAFEGIEVAQGDKSTHVLTGFADFLNAYADPFGAFLSLQINFRSDFTEHAIVGMQDGMKRVTGRKNVGNAAAEELRGRRAEELLGSRTDHDGAGVAREENEAVF